MRISAFLPLLLVILAVPTPQAQAQSLPSMPPGLAGRLQAIQRVVTLSDEQIKKMNDLIAAAETHNKAVLEQMTAASDEYRKAQAANDQAAAAIALAKANALNRGRLADEAKATRNLDGSLTDAQTAKWVDYLYLQPVMGRYQHLTFTPEQLKQIEAIFKAEYAQCNTAAAYFWSPLWTRLCMTIERQVMTNEQRITYVVDCMVDAQKRLQLTDAQVGQIKDQAAKLVKAMVPGASVNSVCMELGEFIREEVLTDDQRVQQFLQPLLARYRNANLTADQLAKIKTAFTDALRDADWKNQTQAVALQTKFNDFIDHQVLTDEQKTRMGVPAQ